MINVTYESLPTAARNVAHAVDFKITPSLLNCRSMARNRGYLSPHIETRLSPAEQRMKQLNNMAASECSVPKVDYKQLNALSSVVFFDTSTKKFKGRRIYDVERIIERRKAKYHV